jgi:hypothetical protein
MLIRMKFARQLTLLEDISKKRVSRVLGGEL